MKKLLLIIASCLLVIALSGCDKSLNSGIVIDKRFYPAHKTYSPMIMRIGGHTRIMPRWIHHSDQWYIWVQDEDIKDSWEVSEDYYNSVNIGDYVERKTN